MNRVIAIVVALAVFAAIFFLMLSHESSDFTASEKPFRFPLTQDPPTLDPVMVTDVDSDGIVQKIFSTLVHYNKELVLEPGLAEAVPEWTPADNSYTFKLRKGVKFHNGREMKAADVKYSWERLLSPDVSKRTEILTEVKGAQELLERKTQACEGLQVVDDYTFKVTLTGPSPTFLPKIAMCCAAVIPKEAVDQADQSRSTFSQHPVGTGPFRFVAWQSNRKIVLRRFDDYYGGKPKLDGILYEVVPESQTRLDRFLKGEFEVTDIPFGQFKRIRGEKPELVSENPALRTNYLGILMNKKDEKGKIVPAGLLGSNANLRQALNCAINRAYLCDAILEGRSVPALSILPHGMPGHDPKLVGWSYNPEKAKALLAEAGYPEGKGLPAFPLYYRKDNDIEKVVLAIQNDLKAVGINVELRSLEWGTFLKKVYNDPPELFYMGWVADFPDPCNFIEWLFHTNQWGEPGNETRYSDPEVDKLLDAAKASMDQKFRFETYNKVEKKLLEDCNWVLLEWRVNYILVQPYVKGAKEQLSPLDVGPLMNNVDFSKVEMTR
ncbi:MAG: ABC transporter substrate-binding protein [Planctomycetes bacterium]|nr:ABC transporter substrate-binding protein [Planctomycetota bacterium]